MIYAIDIRKRCDDLSRPHASWVDDHRPGGARVGVAVADQNLTILRGREARGRTAAGASAYCFKVDDARHEAALGIDLSNSALWAGAIVYLRNR